MNKNVQFGSVLGKAIAHHFVDNVRGALLRGGRMTKYKDKVASHAPHFFGAAVVVLTVPLMLSGSAAVAGSCVGADGVYTCTTDANTETISLTAPAGGSLTVSTSDGFRHDTSSSSNSYQGLSLLSGSGGITFTDDPGSESIRGKGTAIKVEGSGGKITVITHADLTGDNEDGLEIQAGKGVSGVTAHVYGAATGKRRGIDASNAGSGALTITTGDGAVTSENDRGIYALNKGTDLKITTGAGTVSGGWSGISADNLGSGELTITTGAGDVVGSQSNGITALNKGTDIAITTGTGAVTGGGYGIHAKNIGTGDITIDVYGDVTGGSNYAIYTETALDSHTKIQLHAGTVSATSGQAISNTGGDSDIAVHSGSAILGKIVLNAGNDKLTFDGTADFSGVTLFDGGDDASDADGFIDELRFENTGTDTLAGANVVNWERVTIGSGSTIGVRGGALTAGLLSVETGGTLDAPAGLSITGDMANAGTVVMSGDGGTGDVVAVSGDYTGGGVLKADVDFSGDTVDMLTVGGDVTGGTTLVALTNVSPGGVSGSGNDILMVDVSGTSGGNAFALLDGPFLDGIDAYDLEQQGQDWYLTRLGFNSTAAVYEAMPSNLLRFADLPSMVQRIGGRPSASGSVAYFPRGVAISGQSWVRLSGLDLKTSPSTTTSGITDQDHSYWGVEAGVDLPTDSNLTFGVLMHFGNVTTKVANSMGTGTIVSTGYGLGTTATWFGASGFYIDAQARVTMIESDVEASDHRQLLIEDSWSQTYAVSVEAGHRIDVGGALVPQLQLSLRHLLSSEDLVDSASNVVTLSDHTSLTGRLGLAYEYAVSTNSSFYATVNLLHDFSGSTEVDVNTTHLTNLGNQDWLETGLGGSCMLSDTYRIYSEARYRTALDGSDSGYSAVAGISIQW